MRILFCSPTHLKRELGASKIIIELAEEMGRLGWDCEMLTASDVLPGSNQNVGLQYAEALRQYLRSQAGKYDVVEYDHNYLPFMRNEFRRETLFVARSVLLAHHFNTIQIPSDKTWSARIRRAFFGRNENARRRRRIERAHVTVTQADLINVANYDDETELTRCGIPRDRIVVIPYGIGRDRNPAFDSIPSNPPVNPMVVFLGTFDNRKGRTDLPAILQNIHKCVPAVRFRLLGTMRSELDVLSNFPEDLRSKIEVFPEFSSESLPALLSQCSVGVFPSYIEGFGFAVLEMIASSVPVVAYNSPGPPMMLIEEYLVPRGDIEGMSSRAIELLTDEKRLIKARLWARKQSKQFLWDRIARTTSEIYEEHWQRKQLASNTRQTI